MGSKQPTRRQILAAGLGSCVVSALHSAGLRASGTTKVVALMGDYWHNPVALERDTRQIFKSSGWEVTFCQASRFLTPDVIDQADVLFLLRYGGPDSLGWTAEGRVTERNPGDPYMTPEMENAVIRNVRDRGMGLLAFHCTIWNETEQFAELLGVEPIMHGQIQPVVLKDFNQDHPITAGMEPFFINLDEQFAAILLNEDYTPLFMSEAVHDKRYALGGWCGQYGKGRVVSLLPGHTQFPWRLPEYQEIVWRSAHWALGYDIPPYVA